MTSGFSLPSSSRNVAPNGSEWKVPSLKMWPTSIAVSMRSVPPQSGHVSPSFGLADVGEASARSRGRPRRRGDACRPRSRRRRTGPRGAPRRRSPRPRRRPARASRRPRRTPRGSRRPSPGGTPPRRRSRASPRSACRRRARARARAGRPVTTGSAFEVADAAIREERRELVDRPDAGRLDHLGGVERRRQLGPEGRCRARPRRRRSSRRSRSASARSRPSRSARGSRATPCRP